MKNLDKHQQCLNNTRTYFDVIPSPRSEVRNLCHWIGFPIQCHIRDLCTLLWTLSFFSVRIAKPKRRSGSIRSLLGKMVTRPLLWNPCRKFADLKWDYLTSLLPQHPRTARLWLPNVSSWSVRTVLPAFVFPQGPSVYRPHFLIVLWVLMVTECLHIGLALTLWLSTRVILWSLKGIFQKLGFEPGIAIWLCVEK